MPDVAVTLADPRATDVMSPTSETVAIVASDVAHVTVAPLIVLPLASFTTTGTVAVSASEAKLTAVSDNSILAGT